MRQNETDYEQARRHFTWWRARAETAGLPAGRGLNIGYEAVDRHVAEGHGERVALRCVTAEPGAFSVTYAELARHSDQFANALRQLRVRPGDRVCTLLDHGPELYTTVLGTLKNTSVLCPLPTTLGPVSVRQRLRFANTRVLVTTKALYERHVAGHRAVLPGLKHILIVGPPADRQRPGGPPSGTLDFDALLAAQRTDFTIPRTPLESPALLHFTGGVSGAPRAVVHVHAAVIAHRATAELALGLGSSDVCWCTLSPSLATGMAYGVIAPLAHGATVVVDEGGFDARRWYRILDRERVTVWYTTPAALHLLMRAAPRGAPYGLPRSYDLSGLRRIASTGAPLDAETVRWGQDVFGLPVHDTWAQAETGAIMLAALSDDEVRPGSLGRPLPGAEVGVVARGADGRIHELDHADSAGELALRPGWPSMFRGYLRDPERYEAAFTDRWYLTGDLVRQDAEGYLWYVGRLHEPASRDDAPEDDISAHVPTLKEEEMSR